eukprot:3456169-Rhodomonas_salina.9
MVSSTDLGVCCYQVSASLLIGSSIDDMGTTSPVALCLSYAVSGTELRMPLPPVSSYGVAHY